MEKDKTIKIFLASSEELKEDRMWFGDFIQGVNKIYQERGKGVDVFKWELFDAASNDQRKQDEYNEKVRESNMFLALFHKKAGKYTLEECNVAMDTYRRSKKFPKVYIYCKKLEVFERETPELKAFKAEMSKMGYFWFTYSTRDQLHLHFLQQLLMVENSLAKLKYEEGKVTLEGIAVAELANLPFAAGNKNYKEMKEELDGLREEIVLARQSLDKHPDSEKLRNSLQRKLNRYDQLKKEFERLQQTLFDTSQRIAGMQREQLSDKLLRATEAFETGNMERANTLLWKIEREAETSYANLNQQRELVHQDIEAFMLRAKIRMTEVNTPIKERIKQVQAIYVRADEWAKESALPDEKYDGLLDDYSEFLYDYGLYKETEPVYLRLVSIREKLYGKEHEDTAKSYNDIGVFYDHQGAYAKALEYHGKALDICERVLGPDHPSTATSYNNIGEVYYHQGDYAKALEYCGKALDVRERVLGPDHPSTAESYNNIGQIYGREGNYDKALEYLGKALAIWEQVLGPDHPLTALSYNNIGEVYRSQGDYATALEYLGKALDIRERVLGPDHPSTAMSYNNIGNVYNNQGDYDKALEFYGKALDIRERVLGLNHPDTATSYSNFGAFYYNQGDYDKALEYLGKALDIFERVLGFAHPSTALSYENIGAIYNHQGNQVKASEYNEKAMVSRELFLDAERTEDYTQEEIEINDRNKNDIAIKIVYNKKRLDENVQQFHYNDEITKKRRVALCSYLFSIVIK